MSVVTQDLKTTAHEATRKCYHCGDPCIGPTIQLEEKHFCCHGCLAVFELLCDKDLSCYYDLESTPGNQVNDSGSKFDFLDNPEIETQLLDFDGPKLKKVTLYIPGIHCSSCIWLLENMTAFDEGIVTSRINFGRKELSIGFNPKHTSLRQISELLSKLGYEPQYTLDTAEKKESRHNRGFYIKLGIAAFCFGNIMLLSFPGYLGMIVDSELERYFEYLALLLALPVLFYSGQDYFISSFKGLQQRQVTIDVPIALGIATLFMRSAYEVLTQTGSGYFDSLAGLVFFLLIGKWFQSKTYEGLAFDRDYKSYFPLAILKKNKDDLVSVPIHDLRKGDDIVVRHGEIVPADAILSDTAVEVDYSFVTGESTPTTIERDTKVYAGAKLIGSAAKFRLVKEVSQSYLTKLWNNLEASGERSSHTLINSISRHFTFIVLGIAFISGGIWTFYDLNQAFLVFTAVLIIACPCALALATPFTLGMALNIFGKNKFYLKSAHLIETLWEIDHIAFDKTGTITNHNGGGVTYEGRTLNEDLKGAIKSLASNSTHPYSKLICTYLKENTNDLITPGSYEEHVGQGISGQVGPYYIKLGSENFMNGHSIEINSDKATKGLTFLSVNGHTLGRFEFKNQYRSGLPGLLDRLRPHFQLSLISGDHAHEKARLSNIFRGGSKLLFHQKPGDKVKFIQNTQREGASVLMVGDGLNDVAALRQSDLGVAVTDDTSVFTPASDAIILGKQLNKLDTFLKLAKSSKNIIKVSFAISFLYNLVGLSYAVSGTLTPVLAAIFMPLSSISVVLFSTLSVKFYSRFYGLH